MFIMNIHDPEKTSVVSVCDSDILGKRFEGEDIVLDIPESFYSGKEKEIDEIISAISASTSAIIVGDKITATLAEKGIISKDSIQSVAGQSYAMIFRF